MTTGAFIFAVLFVLRMLCRWLLSPERPPAGWDEVPKDWDVEAAGRAMRGED